MPQDTPPFPGKFFLAPDVAAVSAYLEGHGWIAAGETVESVGLAGQGNMNCVLRVVTSARSFILKQSRPWVEKYPSIPAPWDRALMEARFYEAAQAIPGLAAFLPRLMAFDAAERLLLLEDLGAARNFSDLYTSGTAMQTGEWQPLIDFLTLLHGSLRAPELRDVFANQAMRELNHEHIFDLPLRPHNGLNLDGITAGLAALASELQEDARYCQRVARLGRMYVDSTAGECLIHGDYFPGSWLRTSRGVCVIDPEFCFFGPPEWDLGVMSAHWHIAGQPPAGLELALARYRGAGAADEQLVNQFAGVEIMRRLIGVAQLPVTFGIHRKRDLLRLSRALVMA